MPLSHDIVRRPLRGNRILFSGQTTSRFVPELWTRPQYHRLLFVSSRSVPIRTSRRFQSHLAWKPTPVLHLPSPSRGHTGDSAGGGRFHPLSHEDEAELASLLTTKPQHILPHIRQSMLHSRRATQLFRNSVTYLMILLQSCLQRKGITTASATALVTTIMRECVELRQGDMAHLLFRASLRFRKYGLEVGFPMLKYLYDSYRLDTARELMCNMADELRLEGPLRLLAILAYHLGGSHEKATQLFKEISPDALSTGDYCALIDSLGSTGCFSDISSLVDELHKDHAKLPPRRIQIDAVLSGAIIALRGDPARMQCVVDIALKDVRATLSEAALATILRLNLSKVRLKSVADVYAVEQQLCEEIGVASLGLLADTVVITRASEIVVRSHGRGDATVRARVRRLRGFLEAALERDGIDELDPIYALCAVKALGVLGDLEEMRKCFDELRLGTSLRSHRLYDEMMKWYAYWCDVKKVIALKELMSERGVLHTSYTYRNLFKVLDRYYPRLVEQYLMEMRDKGIPIDSQMYPTLLRVFSELQNHRTLENLYTELKVRLSKGESHLFTPAVAIQLIKCYQQDDARCDVVIRDIEAHGLLVHEGIQAIMVHYYTSKGRHSELQPLFSSIPRGQSNAYRFQLREAATRRDRESFQKLLTRIHTDGTRLNEGLLGAIVSGLSFFNDASSVKKYHEDFLASGLVRRPLFYAEVGAAYARMGDTDAVDRCWRDLVSSGMVITMPVYNRFLDLYLSLNNVPMVQAILDTMMKLMPPNVVTATTVIEMLGRMGRLAEMEEVLEEMMKSSKMAPTLVTYHRAMEAYAKCGDVAKSEELRAKMKAQGFKENHATFDILFEAYARSKRYEQLKELFLERKAKGICIGEEGYVLLLNAYAHARMTHEIEEVVADLVKSGILWTSRLLTATAVCHATVGKVKEMEHYVSQLLVIKRPRLRDIEAIFSMFARIRDVVKLHELLDMESLPKSELIYNICVSAFARAGERTKVAFLLTQMEQKGYKLNRTSSMMLGSILLKAGMVDMAQVVLQGNCESSPNLRDESARENVRKDEEVLETLKISSLGRVTGEEDLSEHPIDHDLFESGFFEDDTQA